MPTHTNIRSSIVSKVLEKLATIKTNAGYQTNIGSNVVYWRLAEVDTSEMPIVIVRDRSDTISADVGNVAYHTLTIEVEVVFDYNVTNHISVIEDVEALVGANQEWAGIAYRTALVSNELSVEEGENKIAGLTFTIPIQFRTARWSYSASV